jgi:antitoxin ParD1/3/4
MNISLSDPMRDNVQGRIRRDRAGIEKRWLRNLDGLIARSLAEMADGGGVDLDAACDAVLAELAKTDGQGRS